MGTRSEKARRMSLRNKMTSFDNPFAPDDVDRHYLWDRHMRADIEAFLAGDWSAVAGDFDAENFFALDAGFFDDPANWRMGFPTLAAYRDRWLQMSALTRERADPEKLRHAMYAGAKIARIDFEGENAAILHKVFDGALPLRDGTLEPYGWQSVFTLRRRDGQWRIVSFVGYLPQAGSALVIQRDSEGRTHDEPGI